MSRFSNKRSLRSHLWLFVALGSATIVAVCGAANASTIDPSTITGLNVWLKADAISGLNNGDSVTRWDDSTENGYNYSSNSATKPTYVASGLNGQAVVRFTGSESFYNSGFNLNSAYTVFGVAKCSTLPSGSNGDSNQAWFGANATHVAFGVYIGTYVTANNSFWAWAPNEWSTYGLANSANTNANIHTYTASNLTEESTWGWYLNGVKTGAACETAGSPTLSTTGTYVGYSGVGSEYWKGDIAEILIYDRALSETQIGQVNAYLSAKYVATPEPSSLVLAVAGVFGLVAYAWRKRK
jgi:hypothetical protein